MTLLQITNTIKSISLAQPNIHSFVDEFIDLNSSDAKYSAIILQQITHRRNNDFISYSFYLGYADRLNEDKSNEIEVQSTAIQVIDNIVYALENHNLDTSMGAYNTFTQRFLAEAAGAYVELNITVPVGECTDDFSKEELNVNIVANGEYNYIPTGLGFSSVHLNVDVAKLQDKALNITKNGQYNVRFDKGYSGLGNVDVNVDVDTQSYYDQGYSVGKTEGKAEGIQQQKDKLTDIEITENGTYTREDGYKSVEVNVPADQKPETELAKTLTENNAYVFTPDDGTVYNKVNITTDIHPTEKLVRRYVENNTYIIDGEYNGGEITVNVPSSVPDLRETEITPETTEQIIAPDGFDGYDKITVKGVDASIDSDITPENIKSGVNILGVEGTLEGVHNQDKTWNITENGTYNYGHDAGYTGIEYVSIIVNVSDTSTSNSQWTGVVDENGLTELGWSQNNINELKNNVRWYKWKSPDMFVSTYDKSLDIKAGYSNDTEMKYPKYSSIIKLRTGMFNNCTSLISVPLYEIDGTTLFYTFNGCSNLRYVPAFDTSGVTNFSWMFNDCKKLISVPSFDTGHAIDLYCMFKGCSSLISVPQFNTINVQTFNDMFKDCTSLKEPPQFNITSATTLGSMFENCTELEYVYFVGNPTKIEEISSICRSCKTIQSFPSLSLTECTGFEYAFYQCDNLLRVGELYGKKGKFYSNMFENCKKLKEIGGLDLTSSQDNQCMFLKCTSLTDITFTGSINYRIDFDYCPELTFDSIKSILTACSKTTNTNPKTVFFKRTIQDQNNELTNLVVSCTEKGWTVSGLTISA